MRATTSALLAIVLLAAGCGPLGPGTRVGVVVGDVAPPLAGTTVDGRTVSLADFRGKPVIVNFWASWCVPCRQEFPVFKDAEAHHPGLVILGVVYQDDAAAAKAFATQLSADWPSLTDPDGTKASAYLVVAPPQSYFIDGTGVVRSRQIGEMTAAELARQYAAIAGP
jgi:cytochrome c biogenesis protein CcmG/thiol:disulfide interchange protein DsbE